MMHYTHALCWRPFNTCDEGVRGLVADAVNILDAMSMLLIVDHYYRLTHGMIEDMDLSHMFDFHHSLYGLVRTCIQTLIMAYDLQISCFYRAAVESILSMNNPQLLLHQRMIYLEWAVGSEWKQQNRLSLRPISLRVSIIESIHNWNELMIKM